MWLSPQWMRRGLQALRSTLRVDGRQRKKMIEFLFAEGFWKQERLSWDAAVARWNDCLNPDKAAFFKVAEVWALMKRFGNHDLFLAMAEDLGYDVRRRPTDERRQELFARILKLQEEQQRQFAEWREELARLDLEDTVPLEDGEGPSTHSSQDDFPGAF